MQIGDQFCGVREIARRVDRSPSTISRELRRNAATRSGGLEYRATTAQWHADRRGRCPKLAKLASNSRLREYVQDRLAGVIAAPDGAPVTGPPVRWIGRRHGRRKDRRWRVRGARSRSPTGSRSTSRMIRGCGSRTRRSTSRSARLGAAVGLARTGCRSSASKATGSGRAGGCLERGIQSPLAAVCEPPAFAVRPTGAVVDENVGMFGAHRVIERAGDAAALTSGIDVDVPFRRRAARSAPEGKIAGWRLIEVGVQVAPPRVCSRASATSRAVALEASAAPPPLQRAGLAAAARSQRPGVFRVELARWPARHAR